MKVLDLTHKISPGMPCYPGTEPPKFEQANTYEKDGFKETLISMYTHTGTHVDPPAHLYADRTTLDKFPASQFVGKALVIDCKDLNEGDVIDMARVRSYGDKAVQADFLLFNLGWDKRWGTDEYFKDYACIDMDVLQFLKDTAKKGVGFDVIGLDPIPDLQLVRHNALFKDAEIINIENLKNLDLCGDDLFWFFGLPLKIDNCDGAPIRAIAFWE